MFAVVYIPDFSLQAVLRHEPELWESPLALLENESAKAKVSQATAAARRFGVGGGLSSTQAKARCEGIRFRARSIPQEEAAQEILLQCAYASAAFIESTAPGVCTLDLRGLPILKAEAASSALETWSNELRSRLQAFHLSARVGVAATPGIARQASRQASAFLQVIEPESFWKQLPIESLPMSPSVWEILSKWGIRTASQFLALGKNRIAERLGAPGLELFDEAKADGLRPLRLTAPRQAYEEFFEFEQPIETLEPLLFLVRRLLEQLLARLRLGFLSVSEIHVRLILESGAVQEQAIKVAAPTHDLDALFRITHNYLETVRTPAALSAISLRTTPAEIRAEQFQLFETSVRDPNRFYETISRLNALLGGHRAGTPRVRDSFRSDDFELLTPQADAASDHPVGGSLALEAAQAQPLRGLALRRFRPPLPATVRLKEGSPIFVDSAGPSGSILKSLGPWRSSGHWWENWWAREEWDIQTKDGALYRLFLENNAWFVDGAYD